MAKDIRYACTENDRIFFFLFIYPQKLMPRYLKPQVKQVTMLVSIDQNLIGNDIHVLCTMESLHYEWKDD